MARVFAYADAHRYRIGANHMELPVNRPVNEINNYSKDGAGRHFTAPKGSPVYAPNSLGGPKADAERAGQGGWENDGALVRVAQGLQAEDDNFGQPGTLYREVFTDEQRERLIDTLTGQYQALTRPEVQERFLWYWGSVDSTLATRIRQNVGIDEPTNTNVQN